MFNGIFLALFVLASTQALKIPVTGDFVMVGLLKHPHVQDNMIKVSRLFISPLPLFCYRESAYLNNSFTLLVLFSANGGLSSACSAYHGTREPRGMD